MAVKLGRASRSPASSGQMSDANTYAANAAAYCARSGRADGSHPVINSDMPTWHVWMEYFDHIGHPHGKPKSYARLAGKLTVPANSPDEFEPGWRSMTPVGQILEAAE